jgi:serine/threonine protein kinase
MSKILILNEEQFNSMYKTKNNILSSGAYGDVRETVCNNYVVKESTKNIESIICELDILSRFDSQYIIKPKAMSLSKNKIKIVYDKGILINESNIQTRNIIQIFYDLLVGLKLLHDNNIIHCDIKPPNIIILNDKPVYIDFGISKFCFRLENINDKAFISNTAFTTGFEPPENGHETTRSITGDVYSLGKTFMCIVEKLDYIYSNLPKKYNDDDFNDVIDSMVTPIEYRKSIDELLNMKFFESATKNDNNNIYTYDELEKKQNQMPPTFYKELYILIIDMISYNVETQIIFQCIHNIHRSIELLNNENIIVLFYANFYLCSYKSIIYDEIYCDLSNFINSFKLTCSENIFIEMILALLDKLKCVITTETVWNDCDVGNSLYSYFKQVCNWNYPFVSSPKYNNINNTIQYLKVNDYNSCSALFYLLKKLNTQKEFINFIETYCVILSDRYRIIPKTIKNIVPTKDILRSSVISLINNEDVIDTHHCIYGIIYRTILQYNQDTLFCNTVFDRIIKSKLYELYDSIYDADKLKLARKNKKKNFSQMPINIFTCSYQDFQTQLTNQN